MGEPTLQERMQGWRTAEDNAATGLRVLLGTIAKALDSWNILTSMAKYQSLLFTRSNRQQAASRRRESEMATKVYGASDDLIEFEGDVSGECGGHDGEDAGGKGTLLIFDDGTILEVKYGKAKLAVWQVVCVKPGALFDRIDPCFDSNADPYSDVAHFKNGLQWAYRCDDWAMVD